MKKRINKCPKDSFGDNGELTMDNGELTVDNGELRIESCELRIINSSVFLRVLCGEKGRWQWDFVD